jgi:hypothetical protein
MRLIRPVLSVAAFTVVAASCSEHTARLAAPAGASFIVNGVPTGNSYPNVGALLFDYNRDGVINGDDEWCTGSLIAPTIFLTAAHCVVTPYTSSATHFYVSFSPDLYASSFRYVAATGFTYDPLFGHDVAKYHDLALIFLPAKATKGMTPLRLPAAGILDRLTASGAFSKQLFVNVGYGTSASRTGTRDFAYDGKRSTSKSEFMGLQPTWLGLLMNTSATGEGGDCYGDSGGPKFIDGDATTIYATVTTGDYECRATSWDWRLDTPEARGFLGKYLTLP